MVTQVVYMCLAVCLIGSTDARDEIGESVVERFDFIHFFQIKKTTAMSRQRYNNSVDFQKNEIGIRIARVEKKIQLRIENPWKNSNARFSEQFV